jgi:hypothetical protein
VGLFATVTCKRVAELKRAVAAASADSFVTMTCKPLAGPAQTAPTRHHLVARANVGSFKTQTSKPIAAPPRAGAAANVDLYETTIYKQCAALKQAEAVGNADLFVTATCKQSVGPRHVKPAYPPNACRRS